MDVVDVFGVLLPNTSTVVSGVTRARFYDRFDDFLLPLSEHFKWGLLLPIPVILQLGGTMSGMLGCTLG